MKWVFAAVIAITLAAVGYYATAEAVAALLFGWLSFFARVIPQVRVYWPSVILGTTAFVVFTIGLHWFLRQFTPPSIAASNAQPAPQGWRFRWTAAIVAMVVVAFAAGISLVGIVHQVGWLANSQASMIEEVVEPYFGQQTQQSIKYAAAGLHQYVDIYGRFPHASRNGSQSTNFHSWETMILSFSSIPYSREGIEMGQPWNALGNQKYFKCVLPDFINPELSPGAFTDNEGYGLNNYAANSRLRSISRDDRDEIKDGAANTILLGEVNADFSPWGRPGNVRDPAAGINRGSQTFGGPPNRRGAYFSMADGSARLIAEDVDPEVLKALSTPNEDTPAASD
jgi:hypothetical protein